MAAWLSTAQKYLLASLRSDPAVVQAKANLVAGFDATSQIIVPPG